MNTELGRLRWGVRASLGLWLLTVSVLLLQSQRSASRDPSEVLRVRGLVVEDERGMERVVLGSPLPEPRLLGERFPRGGAVSGLLLFDREGNERGGYVTDDDYGNAMLTLDSVGKMQMIGLVEPDGNVWWNLQAAGGNGLDVRVSEDSSTLQFQSGGESALELPR